MTSDQALPRYALELRGIEKSFGTNQVLKGVSLTLEAGQITALLGANGAGKSTLIKILAGAYDRGAGEILVGGDPVEITSPLSAAHAGVHTVHQRIDESIIPGLTVAENLLFEELARGELPVIGSLRGLLPKARAMAETLNLQWSDAKLMSDAFELGIADAQLLVLARAFVKAPKVLVLDEPTSTLSQAEAERLFGLVGQMRSQGVAILYVSHHLSEIQTLADKLVVLRDGLIKDRQSTPLDMGEAVRSMLGEAVAVEVEQTDRRRSNRLALELRGVQLLKRSAPLDLDLNYGEVTGVVGLLGAGKSELARGIFGVEPFRSGTIRFDGLPYAPRRAGDGVNRGIYLVPENRAAEAMLPGWSLAGTVSLPFLTKVSAGGVINRRSERSRAKKVIDEFSVVTTGPDQLVDALSGGNQQKVVVGRWMSGDPKVVLMDEPFRGVDIGARHDLSLKARDAAARGACVVVFSSDIEEIREVADRILVMVEGQIALDRTATEVDADAIMTSMSEVSR
ncbi:sugar ABC transporter ATP-binding protein [Propionicimonas sp.]|uniref:sugar ABC transporter ATP-binding protein n=1 Tax=Propionicimonas sp. TaxID=1955623 RepID=UPI0017CCBC01|nr:sugar ABC transporter ATP-binding protein [Propionicimonas sp.]MBU3975673.1 sugar ABC transporter ATP-binding protein [Actinomycetota bacterium]MBA3019924.1 sugar ABC transporter ATP-binding protein [Propionicimonas sp.]MBU3986178.1 sugar ABC transporter ATP-binding protein [Actinomycetota bacterium]MBU4007747.1 sugar ABC transporter ATP-binding protein [Actinomycetota bacterium]MBU4064005.1 sugar ABC transporter ATP-binding protein [Actinomycetota bacterium]